MEVAAQPQTAPTPVEVRDRLVETLELDLVGPWPGHELADEKLPRRVRPSNWYLTGFLIPVDAPPEQSSDDDADDEFEDVPESEGPQEESTEDRVAAKKAYFPSSIGLSTLVAADAATLSVVMRWGDSWPGECTPDEESGGDGDGKPIAVWQRAPRKQALEVQLGTDPGVPVTKP